MRLRLRLEAPAGRSADVVAEVDAAVSSRTLLGALAEAVGLPGGDVASAVAEPSGARLEGDARVADRGLADGDRVRLLPPGEGDTVAANGTGVVDLVVVGGPLMGTRVGLSAGEHVVGRGPGADIVLADRSLSRRHVRVSVSDGRIRVADLGSSNGTFVDGVALSGEREVIEGEAVEAGRSLLAFEPRATSTTSRRADGTGTLPFNRPPRVAAAVPAGRHEVPAPPSADRGPGLPIGAALIPMVLAGAMFAITGSPALLLIGVLGPVMAFYSHFEQRRRAGHGREQELERFDAAVAETLALVEGRRSEEGATLRRRHPDAATALRAAAELDERLWERRPGDPDFLELRVGVADRPSGVVATVLPGGDRQRAEAAQSRLDASAVLRSAPVTAAAGSLGLAGNRRRAVALARWLVAQIALHHSPAEVTIAAAVPAESVAEWDWLKWLPHVQGSEAVAVGEAAGRRLLERLAATGTAHDVLLVDGDLPLDRALVAEVLQAGTTVLWLGHRVRDLPGGVRSIVELADDRAVLRLTRVESGEVVGDVAADGVEREWAEEAARLLAPIRDAAGRSDRESLPAQVSLLDLLGLSDPTPAAVRRLWERSADALAAPVGMAAGGPFEIDPARTDGLRALIGGMPGAGKSELLQSLVASLAALHPPNRLAFLLVDYKGGAAFGDCVELPHAAGLVTDLDTVLAERARVSLLAELRRREARLAEAGVRSLQELWRVDPTGAPPAMLIVVDEFATLVRELPTFVDTIVDVAQRGRSLGLHLVLATQRPRGAVSDAIRANTNLRIAMRTADAAESQDVIEAPDAAAIPAGLPGRAVALTGRRSDGRPELTPLQAAYASGRSQRIGGGSVSVSEFALGAAAGAPARELSVAGDPGPTDLQAVATAARLAADQLGLPAPEPPWLPPLPERLDLRELPGGAIGLADDPANRAQEPFAVDLDRNGSLLVFGTSGSGKTTLLRTLAIALAQRRGPRELHLYALDYASRGLQPLAALPQCGAVIGADDEERSARLLDRLERLAAERRRLLAEHGAASVAELPQPVPRVLLLLDGYPAFAAAFERVRFGRDVQTVQRLAAEGRPLGIHLAITADRRAGVPGGLAGVVPARVVLRMADEDDYPALGVPRAVAAGAALPAGRGFTADGLLMQTAIADPALIDELAARHPGERAPRVRTLPDRVDATTMPPPPEPLTAVAGIEDTSLQPALVDLREDHFLIAGPMRSGRSTALVTLIGSLRRAAPDLEVHVLAPRRSPLSELRASSVAAGADECRAAADRLAGLVERPPGAPVALVVVDDGAELAELPVLETLVRNGRDHGVRILAAVETHAAQRAYGGWLRELRAARLGLLLRPDVETDGELLGVKLPRGSAPIALPGRGFLVEAGAAELVQVAAQPPA